MAMPVAVVAVDSASAAEDTAPSSWDEEDNIQDDDEDDDGAVVDRDEDDDDASFVVVDALDDRHAMVNDHNLFEEAWDDVGGPVDDVVVGEVVAPALVAHPDS